MPCCPGGGDGSGLVTVVARQVARYPARRMARRRCSGGHPLLQHSDHQDSRHRDASRCERRRASHSAKTVVSTELNGVPLFATKRPLPREGNENQPLVLKENGSLLEIEAPQAVESPFALVIMTRQDLVLSSLLLSDYE